MTLSGLAAIHGRVTTFTGKMYLCSRFMDLKYMQAYLAGLEVLRLLGWGSDGKPFQFLSGQATGF